MVDINFCDALPFSAVESFTSSPAASRPVRTIICLMASDTVAVIIALFTASALRDLLIHAPFSAAISSQISAALILTLCSFTAAGLYPGITNNPVEELRRSTSAVTLAFLALWSATFFLREMGESRLIYVIGYLLAVCFIPLMRSAIRLAFAARPWWGSQVAILGFGATGKSVYSALQANPALGLKPVAVLDDNPRQYLNLQAENYVLRGPLSRCPDIAGDQKIPYGIICMPELSRQELLSIVELYGPCFGHLIVIPNLIGMTSHGIAAREVGGIVGLELRKPLLRPSARFLKRLLDLGVTLVLSPAIVTIVFVFAVLLKMEGGGPVFYANERVGYRGKRFKAWKLRSMVSNGDEVLKVYLESHPEEAAVWQVTQKLKHDPRVTRVGAIIRKTSIDELPQFWNVFLGEMSVVGPRPILPYQITLYGDGYRQYKQMRPGITGLWQISGRNNLSFADRSRLDRYVIQNWSVWLDLYILARTPAVVFTARGAC
jgi:Undecaprenyl-phosphate galactose phosphotransferase WbaP